MLGACLQAGRRHVGDCPCRLPPLLPPLLAARRQLPLLRPEMLPSLPPPPPRPAGSMFVQQKRDPAVARAELRRNTVLFAAACLAVRAVPYILDFLQKQRA